MTTGNLEQKVRQLDNDVHAVHELVSKLSTTQGRHTNRLAELTEDVAAIKASVAAHDARFDRVEDRLDRVEGKIDRVLTVLEGRAD